MGARHRWVLEPQIAGRRAADRQRPSGTRSPAGGVHRSRWMAPPSVGVPQERHRVAPRDTCRWQSLQSNGRGNGGRLLMGIPEVLKRVGRFDLAGGHRTRRGGCCLPGRPARLERHVFRARPVSPGRHQLGGSSSVKRSRGLPARWTARALIKVSKYSEDDSVPYIAMEYLPYGSLRQYVSILRRSRTSPAPWRACSTPGSRRARRARHQVHRDLKPENLLVAADGRVKIATSGPRGPTARRPPGRG